MSRPEDDVLARMRAAFSSARWADPGPGCPDTETLWASAVGELEPGADEPVLRHLARCAECAAVWRLAREMIHDEGGTGQVVSLGKGGRAAWWRRPAWMAAAAALLVSAGIGTALLVHRGQAGRPSVYRRQGRAVTITPAPATRRLPRSDCRLRWSPGPPGTRYDLTVTDGNLEVLAVIHGLTVPRYRLAPEKIPASVHEILWRVTAHTPGGGTVASATFTSRIVD